MDEEEMAVRRETMERLGKALFGSDWKGALAAALGVHRNTLNNYTRPEDPRAISDKFLSDFREFCATYEKVLILEYGVKITALKRARFESSVILGLPASITVGNPFGELGDDESKKDGEA